MSLSIEHAAIAAEDTDALAEWYCTHFGFTIRTRGDQPPRPYFLAHPQSPVLIELIPVNGSPRAERQEADPGHSHFAFKVDDFEATYKRLVDAGIRFAGPPNIRPNGTKLAFFYDGEGNLLQIVYRPQPL
jgi:glyoxylase I family protein